MTDLTLVRVVDPDPALVADLQRLCDEAPDYYRAVEGKIAGPNQAANWFDGHNLPPGYTNDDLFIHGIYVEGRLIGMSDVLRGWKGPEQSIVGLLLFA